MSWPSKTDRARRSARAAARGSRPSVDLPQPDSPTRPSVSPGSHLEADAVDGLHDVLPRAGSGRPCARRKCLRARRSTHEQRLAHCVPVSSAWIAVARRAAWSAGVEEAARRGAPSPRAVGERRAAPSQAANAVRAAGRGTARPAGSVDAATAAGRGIAVSRLGAWPVERAGSSRAAPTCTGAAGRRRDRACGPARRRWPAYMTIDAVGDARRRRPCRA